MAPESAAAPARIFDSFWIGGFEAATHINGIGKRLDMIAATQHDLQVDADYARLRSIGIQSARDAVRWHLIERNGHFDFSSLAPMVAAAERHGIQVIWSLCHYGWPDDVDVFSPEFPQRFARFSAAVAAFIHRHTTRPALYVPMNEISFLAWAAGEVGWFHPFVHGRGNELKQQLVRATLASCDALWNIDRRTRIVHVDPVIHVVPPVDQPDLVEAALHQRQSQFEAFDMLAGVRDPHLGGHPRYLDILGVNYYEASQWQYPGGRLQWAGSTRDPRRMPFHQMLREVYDRFRRPLFVGETSHVGSGRAEWLREIAAEITSACGEGVPLEGVCLFPIIDRMDWHDEHHWHNSGLWDLVRDEDGRLERVLNQEYAEELRDSQVRLARYGRGQHPVDRWGTNAVTVAARGTMRTAR